MVQKAGATCILEAGGARVPRPGPATDEKAAVLSKKTPGEAQAEQDIKAAAGADADRFLWSKEMLQWQRSGYHFQPDGNFMNGVVWNKIAWGHAVSSDLVHWRHLPVAMVPDQWYDINGVLTGSATMLPNGTVILLYTGNSDTFAQVQCLAFPADPADPLLRTWTKHPANPVIFPPPGIGDRDFRDPMAAWFDKSDNTWRTIIGSKDDHGHAGIALMYKTKDFIKYELIPDPVHRVEGTGMWECIDLYPISGGSDSSEEVIHVMKASVNDEWHDYYALGRFDAEANRWTPLDPEADVGIGMRVDWGKFYASTSFYDPVKQRRVSWGFVGETDSPNTDIAKGWASLQEIDTLRYNTTNFSGITVESSSVITLPLRQVSQLDIEASFRLNASAIAALNKADVSYNCSTSGGATERGALGPFGLLIHATNSGSEQLAVYFYIYKGLDGGLRTQFCHDESGSSRAKELLKRVVGSTMPVLHGEALSARVLVDHSIVESFVMGGRMTRYMTTA
ncbi:6(G)-fructosyltransferase [Triticum urartu]|uniref:6(G)-fructosyltransferase n=1 Tax=Triticum urartu TaxID=4572 RepID=M7Z3H2_TRIUA|nr:6(G)-fructosyltransferase [Triticum urartu]